MNAQDKMGHTVLMYAIFVRARVEIIQLLASDAGESLNAQDKKGNTALMYAIVEARAEIIQSLVDAAGESLDFEEVKGRFGQTAYDMAEASDNPRIFEIIKSAIKRRKQA